MEKKYKLTEEIINYEGHKLYRIEALKDFGNVQKGDKGGFVEKEDNLSHNGNAWVCGDAKIYGDAEVYDNAWVCGDSEVFCDAEVFGNAKVCDNVWIYDDAKVYGNARVYGNAKVCGDTKVFDKARVYNDARVCGDTEVYGNAWIYDNAWICDCAIACGNARICGDVQICGDAEVSKLNDYIVFKNWWSSGRYFTWTRSNNMWQVGCFHGTGEELIAKAYKDSELSGQEYERIVKYVQSIFK